MLINDQLYAHLTFNASCMIYHTSTYFFNSLYYVHPINYMLEIKFSYLILKVTYLHDSIIWSNVLLFNLL